MRDTIFISYSHEDDLYKKSLEAHLSALKNYFNIKIWSDKNIETGSEWNAVISQKISETAVAILLVSKDYLASKYIAEKEIKPIFAAHSNGELEIIQVIITPCIFSKIKNLSKLQAVNDPSQPLCAMSVIEQDYIWSKVAEDILEKLEKLSGLHKIKKDAKKQQNTPHKDTAQKSFEKSESINKNWHRASIIEKRSNVREDYRCYKLDKTLPLLEGELAENESHWLFYRTGEFEDLKIGDRVVFNVTKINELRNWNDLKNTRNIYISELLIDAKKDN